MLRTAARSIVEGVVTRTGLTALSRRRSSDAVAILSYHNVVPAADAGRGDVSLHLPLPRFIEQVERLIRTHDVVDLHTALTTTGTRPRAVITFDDAYRGAITIALPELRRRGLPATVFVAPALLGAPSTWWDEMGAAGLLTDAQRDVALTRFAGESDAIRSFFGVGSRVCLPETYAISTVDELAPAIRDGMTLGSHSWAHEHLPSLPDLRLRDSLIRSRQWLLESELPFGDWLALPYGAGSEKVAAVAREIGHSAVLLVRGGLRSRSHDPAAVPRINVPAGLSPSGLELRTSGFYTR